MGQIANIRKRSNDFVRSINVHIAMAIESKDEDIVDFNRAQMLQSKRSDNQTITPRYTPRYAAFKGISNPNLLLTGEFQGEMFLNVNENDESYFIGSFDSKAMILVDRYSDKIFGLNKTHQVLARQLTTAELARTYKNKVLG